MYWSVSAAYGPVFYTHRRHTMSGHHLEDGTLPGRIPIRNPPDTKSLAPVVKQHNYEQIDHAHFLANDIGTLYLNDRLETRTLFIIFMREVWVGE